MFSIFRPLIERVKALFAVSAAQELETDLLLREAERRAELLRRADRYESEGLHGIAHQLRQQAETVTARRPLEGVLPALEHLAGDMNDDETMPLLASMSGNGSPESTPKSLPAPKKKGKKSR